MNNKGFTLVELLAAISILAIISVIAIPRVLDIMEKNKKEAYINDAKRFYALVQYEKRKNSSLSGTVNFNDIDTSDLDKSPSDISYSSGYVDSDGNICLSDGIYTVFGALVDLEDDNRIEFVIEGNNCQV